MTLKRSTVARRHAAFLAAELGRPSIYVELATRRLGAGDVGCAGGRRAPVRAGLLAAGRGRS
jgi:hypothetical protein